MGIGRDPDGRLLAVTGICGDTEAIGGQATASSDRAESEFEPIGHCALALPAAVRRWLVGYLRRLPFANVQTAVNVQHLSDR
jgi:hypothetical protein